MGKRLISSFLFSLLICCYCSFLNGEIQSVVISFKAEECNEDCKKLLKRQFEYLPQVSSAYVQSDSIILNWKPDQKFSYNRVNLVMKKVGLSAQNIEVRARGTIVSGDGGKLYLDSIGDNTKFELLNAPEPSAQQYFTYGNPIDYKIDPMVRKNLEEAKAKSEMVNISGFLLEPWQRPLTIVLNTYQVEQQAE